MNVYTHTHMCTRTKHTHTRAQRESVNQPTEFLHRGVKEPQPPLCFTYGQRQAFRDTPPAPPADDDDAIPVSDPQCHHNNTQRETDNKRGRERTVYLSFVRRSLYIPYVSTCTCTCVVELFSATPRVQIKCDENVGGD